MRLLLLVLCLGLLGLAAACSDDNPTAPAPTDPGQAAAIVDSANDSLGSVMRTMLDSLLKEIDSTFRPSDADFTGVNTMYERALAADPTNLDAQFGAGFTELLTFFSDPDINNFYERAKRFVDTTVLEPDWVLPVRMMFTPGGLFGPDFMPAGFPLSTRGVPGLIPDLPRLDHALQVSAAADPQPSDLQEILETRLLPRITQARSRMQAVASRRNYVFWITPEMQGNPGADSIELDMTEVRLALAALYGVEAAVHVATARHLDVESYTGAGLSNAFNVGSSFLTLKPDGVDKMQAAKEALLETLAQADSALEFLMHETDPDPSDDLIPFGSDAVEILDSIRSTKLTLTQIRTFEFTNGSYSLVTDVDAARFFDDPVVDPKAYLPGYTFMVFQDTAYKAIEATYFSAQTYWDSLSSKYGVVYPNDTDVYYSHLPDQKTDLYYELLAFCQAVWGWADIYEWMGQPEYCYSYSSPWQQEYMNSYYSRLEIQACVTWDATTFVTWTFPEPTFNGLFPSLTSNEIRNFIIPGGSFDWEQETCAHFER